MSDRFKFRCVINNKVKDVFYFYELPTNKEIVFACTNLEDNTGYNIPKSQLLQCTGLKDKNGKLIYEGDVIVIPNQYPFYDYKNEKESQNLNDTNGEIKGETILNYVGVVEYIFNGWQYVLNCVNPLKRGISNGINYHLNEQGFEENENSCYKVIGNIYEDSHLIENSNNLC